jgi:galactokinase
MLTWAITFLAIINTNKPRELADSKYNERVAECQTALKLLNEEITLHYLCELTAEKFALHSHLITDQIILTAPPMWLKKMIVFTWQLKP